MLFMLKKTLNELKYINRSQKRKSFRAKSKLNFYCHVAERTLEPRPSEIQEEGKVFKVKLTR